jgi:hypothetical protein
MNDDGCEFHAIVTSTAGERFTRETPNRRELLLWIDDRQRSGDELIELGMTARAPAIGAMLQALWLGAAASD